MLYNEKNVMNIHINFCLSSFPALVSDHICDHVTSSRDVLTWSLETRDLDKMHERHYVRHDDNSIHRWEIGHL